MKIPKISLSKADSFKREVKARIPFRFGKSILKSMPIIHLRVKLKLENGEFIEGFSGCGIPPLWFDKNTDKSEQQHQQDLLYSLKYAIDKAKGIDFKPAFELHQEIEPDVFQHCIDQKLSHLTSGFGLSLMDNAIIDAVCRYQNQTFFEALKTNSLGFGESIVSYLPKQPVQIMNIRHTVGLADIIYTHEIKSPLNDGLPESLEQILETYKVKYLKIKVNGDIQMSADRLSKIADLIEKSGRAYQITLDGNEQFNNMADFFEFYQEISSRPALKKIFSQIIWIEEPVMRKNSLNEENANILKGQSLSVPVIIDESAGSDEAFTTALKIGYQGSSAKNCKGVYRTLKTFLTIHEQVNSENLILSSEDLTNVPVLPFHQDICVAAALGIPHSERNGHHFIRGFDYLSSSEKNDTMNEFPSLYYQPSKGTPALKISDGTIDLKEVNNNGFGSRSEPDWDFLEDLKLPEEPSRI